MVAPSGSFEDSSKIDENDETAALIGSSPFFGSSDPTSYGTSPSDQHPKETTPSINGKEERSGALGALTRRLRCLFSTITPLGTVRKAVAAGAVLLVSLALLFAHEEDTSVIRLAMVGNSMMYYNDMARVLVAMAAGRLHQNSALHGNANFSSHLWYGNGMYDKWRNGQARMWDIEDTEIYDYGACSVQQLFFGKDDRLADDHKQNHYGHDDDSNNSTIVPEDAWKYDLLDDGTNPCIVDDNYNDYQHALYEANGRPSWDFVLINDNTRNPCCTEQRAVGMQLLEDVYLPWIKEIKAIPIFMLTYGYWASKRDMTGLVDIPTFTSLTYNGYQDYVSLAEKQLPASLKPRIAPVGLAFLMVYEEDPSLWAQLIHSDEIHPSPSGTFLQACIVHATIFGKLPPISIFDGDEGPDRLWRWARPIPPVGHESEEPYPTRNMTRYLYHIAHRVVVLGEMPKSLAIYPAGTSADFVPDDTIYSKNPQMDGSS